MNENLEAIILKILEKKELSEDWRRKVVNSVHSIDIVFQTQVSAGDLNHCILTPNQIWVNCEEEIDLDYAAKIQDTLSVERLAPITAVEYGGKHVIYMGSVRAVLFCRYQQAVECIVVKLHTDRAKIFFDTAKKRLSEFDIYS